MQETWVRSLGREDALEKEMATQTVSSPGESHGWRSLVGYSPRGRKESDTTERLHFHFSNVCGFFFLQLVLNGEGCRLSCVQGQQRLKRQAGASGRSELCFRILSVAKQPFTSRDI